MKHILFITFALLMLSFTSCKTIERAAGTNVSATVRPHLHQYDELTMELDENPISYTIDISSPEGKIKLNKITLAEAQELALVEAVMYARCATMFNPQYTYLTKGNKVLRVTVYGYPARYKKKIDSQSDK